MFYTILTTIGLAKMANAVATNTTVDITHIAVGDGGGVAVTPDQEATALVNEVWRAAPNSIAIDAANANWVVVEGVIPATTGGFTIRELGLFDVDGDLIAVGNYPESYKPVLAEGAGADTYIKATIAVSNADAVTLKIDPAIVLASRQWVDDNFYDITEIGDMSVLETGAKSSLVAAINEVNFKAERAQHKNKLIGGDFSKNPWQRGTSIVVTATNTYVADRHVITFDGTANITVDKVALGIPQKIAGRWCTHAMKVTVNSSSGNTYVRLAQRIEDVSSVEGEAAILSCSIEGSSSFSVPVQLRQMFGTGGAPDADVVTVFTSPLSVTPVLQKLTSNIDVPSISGKTLGTDGIEFTHVALEYDLINVPVGGYILIPLHQFEPGMVPTVFDDSLSLSEYGYSRYMERITGFLRLPGQATNTDQANIPIPYKSIKRSVPALSFSSLSDFALTGPGGSGNTVTSKSTVGTGIFGAEVILVSATLTTTTGYATRLTSVNGHIDIDAEIY